MKCAHPACHRGIGLVSHRRGFFDTRLFCSRACRDRREPERSKPRSREPPAAGWLAWLLDQLAAKPSVPTAPAVIRIRAR
jgi:hypothetical protein